MEATTARVNNNVLQVFGSDHERMREILRRAILACTRKAAAAARQSFDAYDVSLRRHIQAEEDVLFPAFEGCTGLRDTGPTAVMRREHREFERRLTDVREALRGEADLALAERHLLDLQALLADHDRREEQVLYPACDRLISEREQHAAVHALAEEA